MYSSIIQLNFGIIIFISSIIIVTSAGGIPSKVNGYFRNNQAKDHDGKSKDETTSAGDIHQVADHDGKSKDENNSASDLSSEAWTDDKNDEDDEFETTVSLKDSMTECKAARKLLHSWNNTQGDSDPEKIIKYITAVFTVPNLEAMGKILGPNHTGIVDDISRINVLSITAVYDIKKRGNFSNAFKLEENFGIFVNKLQQIDEECQALEN